MWQKNAGMIEFGKKWKNRHSKSGKNVEMKPFLALLKNSQFFRNSF